MYLCGRRPDHSKQQHFLIPELLGQGSDAVNLKVIRKQLRTVPASCFERIMQDVYDEPNPQLSATRNQLRQKLAVCDARELATLIIDALCEAKRRRVTCPSDNRDYDEVAESPQNKSRISGSTKRSSDRKSDDSGNVLQENVIVSVDDFLELKEKVFDSETKLNNALAKRQPSPKTVLTSGASASNIPSSLGFDRQSVSSSKPPHGAPLFFYSYNAENYLDIKDDCFV
uniref:GIT Spa2 homology (SHD) domain-containing protein n=1 Tax=Parascaris equorum TaxID=6256 RepID=A0A914RUH3_PAREQ